jgi:hypothetical protein
MVISTYCVLMAPRLALLGPPGSLKRAVSGLHYQHKRALHMHMSGVKV